MIKLVRIDHRLLHGQVVFSWCKQLNIERIIVVDDTTAGDEFQKVSLNLSKPTGTKLNIFSVKETLEKMPKIEQLPENIMMIFGNTSSVLSFCQQYSAISEINYGVITKKEGSKQYSQAIYLNNQELEDSIKLKNMGIELFMQQVPASIKEVLIDRI